MLRKILALCLLICILPVACVEAAGLKLNVKGVPPVYRGIIFSVVLRVSQEAFGLEKLQRVFSHRSYYESGLRKVLDEVISGYQVEELSLEVVDKKVVVNVAFSPKGALFTAVEIRLPRVFKLLPLEIKDLLQRDVKRASKMICPVVSKIPIGSMEWGGEVLLQRVNQILKRAIPGFGLASYVEIKKDKLVLGLTPMQPVVSRVDVNLFSDSIPIVLLREQRAEIDSIFSFLSGIPVRWIKFHLNDIKQYIVGRILGIGGLSRYDVTVLLSPSIGRLSKMDVQIESNRYRIKLAMVAYVGAGDKHSEVNFHFGYKPKSRWEVYGDFWIDVSDFSTENFLGTSYALNPCWIVGVEYNVDTSKFRFRVFYVWGGRNVAEGFYYFDGTGTGVMIGYKVTEHIKVDLVYDSSGDKNFYVRVSNNL